MYKLIRPILFKVGAEAIHRATVAALKIAGRTPGIKQLLRACFTVSDPRLERRVLGLRFPNPVGMAAGFDKNAEVYRELSVIGPGFVEVGTITPRAQSGNPRPRLFRLPGDRALINRMGFNNKGVEAAAERLRKRRSGGPIVGINLGKNTDTNAHDAPGDYLRSFRLLYEFGDYFVINVSCPNVEGLTGMQNEESLRSIVGPLLEFRHGQEEYKPILVKIAPDLTLGQIDGVINIVIETLVDGIVATNTTTSREGLRTSQRRLDAIGRGGLSGAPLTARSLEMIRYVRARMGDSYPIIGSGGVMTTTDALAMLDAGADLVQIYTGLIYNGPSFARKICKALLRRETPVKTGAEV